MWNNKIELNNWLKKYVLLASSGFRKIDVDLKTGKVTGMFYYFDRYRSASESPLSWNLPKEATQILDHEKNLTASGTLNYIFDQNTF